MKRNWIVTALGALVMTGAASLRPRRAKSSSRRTPRRSKGSRRVRIDTAKDKDGNRRELDPGGSGQEPTERSPS